VDENPPLNWSLRRGMATTVTLAAVALAGLLVFFATRTDGADQPVLYPTGLRSVVPTENATAPRQGSIGVSVGPGWAPSVSINGVPVPDGQLDGGTRQLGEYLFAPGPGQVIEEIRPGRNCATVRAVATVDRDVEDFEFSWCWTAF
jgi:hypothetical protein